MERATAQEKVINSLINIFVVFLLFLPFLLVLETNLLIKKIVFISLFFFYKIAFILFNKNRTIGMIITNTCWQREYPFWKQFLHALLYTASFSTLLFWVVFPFDIFLVNMFFLQLPTIILRKMTFHEFLVGGMEAIKK